MMPLTPGMKSGSAFSAIINAVLAAAGIVEQQNAPTADLGKVESISLQVGGDSPSYFLRLHADIAGSNKALTTKVDFPFDGDMSREVDGLLGCATEVSRQLGIASFSLVDSD